VAWLAAVLLSDTAQELQTGPEALRRWYNFTAAEARGAALLAQGRTVEEVAELSSVRPNTVRRLFRALNRSLRAAAHAIGVGFSDEP
jgi:DNA-binding CsgD family transcriptional regulator